MKKNKRITAVVLGLFGGYLYNKRHIHQFYFVHVEGRPLEEYDPQPVKGFL